MGDLGWAPAQFEAARDVPQGGVLLALPALLATGLLRFSEQFYALRKAFAASTALLALMALARLASLEQLRYVAPGEWGNLLGLDRIPEVRTLLRPTISFVYSSGIPFLEHLRYIDTNSDECVSAVDGFVPTTTPTFEHHRTTTRVHSGDGFSSRGRARQIHPIPVIRMGVKSLRFRRSSLDAWLAELEHAAE
jgi:hypothetical protein